MRHEAARVRAANRRWSEMLAARAIPQEILAAAPESPWFFDVGTFAATADEAVARGQDTPSDAVAREVLPTRGTVLDVGAGAGASSLRLADQARLIVAVDMSGGLLDAFAARAARLGIEHAEIEGRWPEIAPAAPMTDVVVCHHLVYNVADLSGLVSALTAHAIRRVVVELTVVHPLAWMNPYWEALHGVTSPPGPTVGDAVEVVTAMGLEVQERRWRRPFHRAGENTEDIVKSMARRLCLTTDRHDELRPLLAEIPPPRERDVATIWWDIGG